MEIKSKELEVIDINSIIAHPKNMHTHSPEQIDRLVKLIEYQGYRQPVIVQKGTNLIVAGHGRALALKKMGISQIPVMYQEFDSDAQLYAFMVSDNAIGKDVWATLDLSSVNTEMLDLGPDFDIDLLGIKDFSVDPIEKFEMEDEIGGDINKKFILKITFPNDMEMMDIHDDLLSRGYIVKVENK